jgi:hypothetical protein
LHLSSPVIGLVGSYERLPDGFFESRQSRRDVCAEIHAQDSPIALCECLEVAARFGRLDDTKGVFLARYLEIGGVVATDLQEHAASIRWIVVDLAGMSGFSRSLDGWICNPPVRGEAPLTANPWMKGRFQSKGQRSPFILLKTW